MFSEATPRHIVKCRCQNSVFRIFSSNQDHWGECVSCDGYKVLRSEYLIVCKGCGTICGTTLSAGQTRGMQV